MRRIEFRRLSAVEEAAVRPFFGRGRVEVRPTRASDGGDADPGGMTRRRFLQSTGGLVIVSHIPVISTGCADPITAIALGIALLELAQKAFEVAEDVQGYVQLVNNGDKKFRGEMLMELLKRDDLVDEGIGEVEVPPKSDPVFSFGDLYGADPGKHNVQSTVGGAKRKSAQFDIVG